MVDNSKYTPNPRQFSKSNFVDLLEILTPKVYQQEDLDLSGTELNPLSQVINTHLSIANNISTVLPVSSVQNSQTSNLSSIGGISQYFVKQNELTNITTQSFRQKILLPLSSNFSDFETSGEFVSFLSADLLPKIIPPGTTTRGTIEDNVSELSAYTNDASPSSIHNYLVDNLGWFYFLNTSALGGLSYSPSSFVLSNLSRLYRGANLETVDGVKGLTEYIWKNVEACSFGQYIPSDFLSSTADANTDPSSGEVATYTSGTQKLDNLLTLVDVIYSPLAIDKQDFRVKAAFDDFIDAQLILEDKVSNGPFRKILNALGFHFADISNQVEDLRYLYDIENVDQERLQYIADLIGFRLRGNQSEKWRHQLRTAVDIYKKSGTQESLRSALNAIIVNSVIDVDNKIIPLWESYLPFIVWYALSTGSPLFKNLRTWTLQTAKDSGVFAYSTSSLEENLKLVTDSILLDLASAFPTNFKYFGQDFPFPRFYILNPDGTKGELYTVVGDTKMKPWHAHPVAAPGYLAFKRQAYDFGEAALWERAVGPGPFGEGVYMAGLNHPTGVDRPTYLLFEGDPEFVFNYRNKYNYPMPPFEEVKYYRECIVTKPLVDLLVERLKCFKVQGSFAEQVGNFLVSSAATDTDNINSLNEFLMFFSSVQLPPNYDHVIENISDFEKNALSLWNGKSSHIFIDFDNTDFDFRKNTLESDSKYALYEVARVAQEFTPAHTIPKVNLNASADDPYDTSATRYSYLGFDEQETRVGYASGSVLANAEISGVLIGPSPFDPGRGGFKTFKRDRVNTLDGDLSSTNSIVSTSRRALRRRNLKFLLPEAGYYDRTGFNGPTSFDPSVLENSMASSLGEFTLGYVASAGKFHPVVDHTNVTGVWNICENVNSSRTFSGVDTSNTFPYRGLNQLGSDAKMPEIASATARYVDRGQTPRIIRTMHSALENKARRYAELEVSARPTLYANDTYWKDQIQSFANSAIASGYAINTYQDYENFSFGRDFQYLFADYTKAFGRHVLGKNIQDKTGANIFAHVFGKALFNGDFDIVGEYGSSFVQNNLRTSNPINNSTVFADGASGTFVASSLDQAVVPLLGTYVSGSAFDYRNPTILSGIEFCDISGAPSRNEFRIIDLDSSAYVRGQENYFINNPVIKCKSVGGLPRIRFDVSSYGPSTNQLIPEHKFKLNVKALVADENKPLLGGGQLGVWIHTEPASGLMWSWTEDRKWTPTEVSSLSIDQVILKLCHRHTFNLSDPGIETLYCLNSKTEAANSVNDLGLTNIKESFFHNVAIDFDTRNFTIHNNYEYLDIIPKTNEQFKITDQVHKDRNYVIEIFFIPNNNYDKYLLIDSIGLQDTTLRYQAGISTGLGVQTSGIPLRPFVREFKYEFNKQELADILSFYNGLLGYRAGENTTILASRDASITSGVLEVSGGSRISYRVNPEWVSHTDGSHGNYTQVEFDN
jgi:hypothetical protein